MTHLVCTNAGKQIADSACIPDSDRKDPSNISFESKSPAVVEIYPRLTVMHCITKEWDGFRGKTYIGTAIAGKEDDTVERLGSSGRF